MKLRIADETIEVADEWFPIDVNVNGSYSQKLFNFVINGKPYKLETSKYGNGVFNANEKKEKD